MISRLTRIIGHMVTYNEMDRYLTQALTWLRHLTDDHVYVHDDQSADDTYAYITDTGVPHSQRCNWEPAFADSESQFRQTAWRLMEEHFKPTTSDWILCVDADEFVVAPKPEDTRGTLTDVIEQAAVAGAVTLPVHEVFGFDGDTPLLRVDGYWGAIVAHRLVRWRPGHLFKERTEGGGSIPTGWGLGGFEPDDLALLHLGYAREEDRRAKHARYRATGGHNPRHVASILEPPTLVRWPAVMDCL